MDTPCEPQPGLGLAIGLRLIQVGLDSSNWRLESLSAAAAWVCMARRALGNTTGRYPSPKLSVQSGLVVRSVPASCPSLVWVYHSAINVGDTRLSLVRLRARLSSCAKVLCPYLGLVWCGCAIEWLPCACVLLVLGGTNLPSRATIPNQPAAERGDGALLSYFYVGVCQLYPFAVDMLMQILDKPFRAKDLLHVYTVVQPKKELVNPFYKVGNFEMGMMAFDHSRDIIEVCLIPVDLDLPISISISISSSNSEHLDDLARARPPFVGEAQDVGLSLVVVDTMRVRNLKKKTMLATDPIIIVPLVIQSLNAQLTRSWSLLRRMALERAVMLPNTVATLSERDFGYNEKSVSDTACLVSLKGNGNLGSYGRTVGLAKEVQKEDEQLRIQAEEGQALAGRCRSTKDRFGCQFCIPEGNPAWTKSTPAPKFPKSSPPYSPMVLPGFNELEYLNRPEESEDAADVTGSLITEATNLIEEAGMVSLEESMEGVTKVIVKDASQDPLADI
ncbi:hypothetical protein Acr_24g0005980 [Actinidia rufa]|uniref:Uncharacterized protein n=1 Tax=Actinidia rufa TaxID=165716 RepID=A0A7J0GUE4_9ERIC|nr:hypothetical protein Acr_24g0005980 [Actinidia rufa]